MQKIIRKFQAFFNLPTLGFINVQKVCIQTVVPSSETVIFNNGKCIHVGHNFQERFVCAVQALWSRLAKCNLWTCKQIHYAVIHVVIH